MEIPAFRISQWGYGKGATIETLYVTSLPMKMLVDAEIDRWTKTNREGYQRPTEESRLQSSKNSVVKYLLEEMGIFPTSVLLNFRGSLTFREETKIGDRIALGRLSLPDKEKLWIIDGQHRLEALKRAIVKKPELEEYPVPVTISNLDKKFEEMLLFYIVNSRQKKIKTELVYRQLQLMDEKVKISEEYKWIKEAILGSTQERQATAALIVDYLADNENSPFYDRILYLGEETEKKHLVEDSLLIRYISKILGELTFQSMTPERMGDLLIDYWNIIRDMYPNCFSENLKDNYTLLKHTGIASFTYLFPMVYALCAEKGNVNREAMEQKLNCLKEDLRGLVDRSVLPDADFERPIDETWWSREHGPAIARLTSEATFNTIKDNMAKKIQLVMKIKKGEGNQ
jgi:DGQHR domain-containing protein